MNRKFSKIDKRYNRLDSVKFCYFTLNNRYISKNLMLPPEWDYVKEYERFNVVRFRKHADRA